jgi:hypothetical protein
MRVTILILIIISCSNTFSQKFPMPVEGATWDNSGSETYCQICPVTTVRTEAIGDTVINSIKYTKLFTTWRATSYMSGPCEFTYVNDPVYFKQYGCAMRTDEDSHVYIVVAGETEERLLYDFSVSVGDTLIFNSMTGMSNYYYVNNIDSILIGNSYRKRITLNTNYGAHDVWIEGIGSTTGLSATWEICWENCEAFLACYQENGVMLYPVEYTCNLCGIVTNLNSIIENKISIYPNPVDEDLFIDFPDDYKRTSIRISDLSGRIIYRQEVAEIKQIRILGKDLKNGLVILEIVSRDGIHYRRKILVE